MSQIMGLPADCLTKPVTKDLTLFAKGQWKGYQAAAADVFKLMQKRIEFCRGEFTNKSDAPTLAALEGFVDGLREDVRALLEDKS